MDMQALELTREATLARHNARQDRVGRNEGYGATIGSQAIAQAYFARVAATITERLKEEHGALEYVLRNLDPLVIAHAALTQLLHTIALKGDGRAAMLAMSIAVQAECWAAGLLEKDAVLYARIRKAALKRSTVRVRRRAARSMAKHLGYRSNAWSRALSVRAGEWLLQCILTALPDVFRYETYGPNVPAYVEIADGAIELAAAAIEAGIARDPVFVPATQSPAPWTRFRKGGFRDERARFSAPFARVRDKQREAAMRTAMLNGAMRPHLDAVNALQSVPWTINTPVLEAMQWAYANNVAVKGVPSITDVPLPARLNEGEWDGSAEAQKLQRYRIARIKERNRGLTGNRILWAADMATASRLASQQAFYCPANIDWRGRVYPVCHFNYQRDDRVRALFLFANGMPIGAEGLYWLKVHVANCGDFDKISKRPFAERVAWTDNNLEDLKRIAASPNGSYELWTKADKPFLFLAACFELAAACAYGPAYLTRLPVSFDGSCSGLQHLCAMTRAAEGSLVNLTPSECPQDVYQTVADLARERIQAEAGLEFGLGPLARQCLEQGITRKLVKRNVMTYSYSSKRFGMAKQHMEDLMRPLEIEVLEGKHAAHPYAQPNDTYVNDDGVEVNLGDGHTASKYIANHIYAAIETVVHLPAQAMAFLQRCSNALAHEGKCLSWTTPTGLPWINRYHERTVKRIELWLCNSRVSVSLADEDTAKVDKGRCANGVAPNFVHALDASHLALTVNAAVQEGIAELATVHDSFGCLAPQAGRFRQIIREQFVQMYETHDVLAEVLDTTKRDLTVHNHGRLPALPSPGPLNLEEVLRAEFAFA